MDHPWLLSAALVAGCINASDAYCAKNHGKTMPHVFWHLSSAALAALFFSYTR